MKQLDTELKEKLELQEELDEARRERDDARRELARLEDQRAATEHYDHLISLADTPAKRLPQMCEVIMNLWLHAQEDAEVAKRMGDDQSHEIYRTIGETVERCMKMMRDIGLGQLPRRTLAHDFKQMTGQTR